MIDAVRARLRPGSKGEPMSKVATTGQEVASEAASVRIGRPLESDPLSENWPAALMGEAPKTEQQKASAIPFHAPDDAAVVNRLFRLGIRDI